MVVFAMLALFDIVTLVVRSKWHRAYGHYANRIKLDVCLTHTHTPQCVIAASRAVSGH